ncbi:diacylglycerol/lipid kinase family protein [Thermodesulfobacteriota bacterium]
MAARKPIMAIVNPNSANGSTRNDWPSIKGKIEGAVGGFEHRFTEGPMDAMRVTREALMSGYKTIISVGGDGTNNEIVNGFFDGDEPIGREAALGVISRGTGSDLIKTLGIPKDLDKAVSIIAEGRVKPIDVGRMTFLDHQGNERIRYFINITSFGMGGAVDERVNRTTKVFGGFVSFFWATLMTFITYRNQRVRFQVDDMETHETPIVNIAVANGKFFGGGMMVAPEAVMDDGLFDIIVLGDMGPIESLLNGPKIYKGTHVNHPKVETMRGRKVTATSDERVLLDVDGEQPGMLPATFEIVTGAVQAIV